MSQWLERARKLKTFLRRRGQTPEDAEDLVQEAFLRLHTFLATGRQVEKTDGFLLRTARNLAIDQSRRRRSEKRDDLETVELDQLPITDLADAPEEVYAAAERLERMSAALETKIGRRAREVFFLHRLEGFTHEEIAKRLNVSVRTIEKDIARAITLMWMEENKE